MAEKLTAHKFRQPFASKIVRGELPILFRPTSCSIRGKILILSTKTTDYERFPETEVDEKEYPLGKAVGTVEIVDCIKTTKREVMSGKFKKVTKKYAKTYPWEVTRSKIKTDTTYAWILDNPEEFDTPKDYTAPRGSQTWVKKYTLQP